MGTQVYRLGFKFKANLVLLPEPFGFHTRGCGSKVTEEVGDCDNNKLKFTLYVSIKTVKASN